MIDHGRTKSLIGALSAIAVALSMVLPLHGEAQSPQPKAAHCCGACGMDSAAARPCCPAPQSVATSACHCRTLPAVPKSPDQDKSQRRAEQSLTQGHARIACARPVKTSRSFFSPLPLPSSDRHAMLCVWQI